MSTAIGAGFAVVLVVILLCTTWVATLGPLSTAPPVPVPLERALDPSRYPELPDPFERDGRTAVPREKHPGLWAEMERLRRELGLDGVLSSLERMDDVTYVLSIAREGERCDDHTDAMIVQEPHRWVLVRTGRWVVCH